MKIVISHIQASSYVDGPGQRTVLFMQGCSLGCPGCQNKHLWPVNGGYDAEVDDVALTLSLESVKHGNVTISGGEPFQQPQALAYLVRRLRELGVHNILIYSGYTWETLVNPVNPASLWVWEILKRINVLVDGRFELQNDHALINWRGSQNQRPINVPASLELWAEDGRLVVHDWDSPRVIVDPDGNLLMPDGLAKEFASIGDIGKTRRCGETRMT